jgi:hypothetical protein
LLANPRHHDSATLAIDMVKGGPSGSSIQFGTAPGGLTLPNGLIEP